MPERQPSGAAAHLSFGAASGFLYLIAAAAVGFAKQYAVEPQVSKGRCWDEASAACGPTTHILPYCCKRFNAI